MFAIDPNGNLTAKTEGTDNWVYTWNAENQLTKVEKNGSEVARFAYDPLGRRVEKVAGGIVTTYTYDREDITRETRNAAVVRYVHGPGVDAPLAREENATLTYYHADALGSVMRRTSQDGATVDTYSYDPWGNLEGGGNDPGYSFTGRERDPETGLYFNRARYYDARSGRFLSQDPLGLRGGLNLYLYADASPASATDPLGLVSVSTNEHVSVVPDVSRVCRGRSEFSCAIMTPDLAIRCDNCGNMKIALTINADIFAKAGTYGPFPPLGGPGDPSIVDEESAIAHERRHVRFVANASEAFLSPFERNYGSREKCLEYKAFVESAFLDFFKIAGDYTQYWHN